MKEFFDLILSDQFMPHGYCFLWRPELVWLHALADLCIALAYFAIPVTILIILAYKRKSLPFAWVFGMFAAFIFLCGLTHVVELIGIWMPFYYIEGIIKIITAAVSIATAILMFPLIPVIINRFEELDKLSDNKNKR